MNVKKVEDGARGAMAKEDVLSRDVVAECVAENPIIEESIGGILEEIKKLGIDPEVDFSLEEIGLIHAALQAKNE